MTDDCGCCEGVGAATPEAIDNPPGRDALSYRVGTHATFFRTMAARLGALRAEAGFVGRSGVDAPTSCLEEGHRSFLLGGEPDAATALLDGFACVADVLTFYQERIANEGYLRTATERRSVVELGRLAGYEPRPGVAASVLLTFTVQEGFDGEIPARTKVQSVPRPGQDAQTFETVAAVAARAEWNAMRPRVRATGRFVRYEHALDADGAVSGGTTGRVEIFLRGMGQGVAPGDVVYLVEAGSPILGNGLFRVQRVKPEVALDHTELRLVPYEGGYEPGAWDAPPAPFRLTAPVGPSRPPAALLAPSGARFDLLEARGMLDLHRTIDAAVAAIRADPTVLGTDQPAREAHARELAVKSAVKAVLADRSLSEARMATKVHARLALLTEYPRLLETPGLVELLSQERPELRETLAPTLRAAAAPTAGELGLKAYVFRASAKPFGHNAPMIAKVRLKREGVQMEQEVSETEWSEWLASDDESENVVFLDGDFATLQAGDPIVLRSPLADSLPQPGGSPTPAPTNSTAVNTRVIVVSAVSTQARRAYDLSGTVTKLTWQDSPWWTPKEQGQLNAPITALRGALLHVGAAPLDLVAEPLEDEVSGATIDLDGVVAGLDAGATLLVEGDRTDVPGAVGLRGVEVVHVSSSSFHVHEGDGEAPTMDTLIAAVKQHALPAPRRAAPYSRLTLTAPLRYRYERSTVAIRGNVARATHGETRDEILGSGDASAAGQRFTLRQGPRTWISAATPSGVASTLDVRVGGVLWPEARSATALGPRDEAVLTRPRAEGGDELVGGDGLRGARFPTGVENLSARYRVGLGVRGNVDAGLLTTLATRPMGVREVTNPMPASGGADPDGRDAIRTRIPVAARGVDRLVSVRDHEDFARNFAGVDKAVAWRGADASGRATVHVAIAGAEGAPVEPSSDLFRNLRAAMQRFGDPMTRVALSVARPVALTLAAKVRLDPRREWSRIQPTLREALYASHGWGARGIGEAVRRSSWLGALQAVPGVLMVDVDAFGALGDVGVAPAPCAPWRLDVARDVVAYFSRTLPDAVSFTQVTP